MRWNPGPGAPSGSGNAEENVFLGTKALVHSPLCCVEPELVENTSNISKEPFTLIRPWPSLRERGWPALELNMVLPCKNYARSAI